MDNAQISPTVEDVNAVIAQDPVFRLQIQVQAMMRIIQERDVTISELEAKLAENA
jgi:hypothetical protein